MNFLRKLWAIYGILVFFLLWVIFLPFYFFGFLLLPKKWQRGIFWFSHHIYTRLFFGLTLVRIRVEGLENLDSGQTYIIVSNHLSAVDFMINAYAYPGVFKFLAKKELTKVPVFGYIVRKMCVLVDRLSAASRSASMKSLKDTLGDGYSVFLYPEGTRNRTDEPLLPFHKGAFRIALESGYPIAVQTLVGIPKIAGKAAGLDYSPGTVRVIWDKPIETKGLVMKELDGLMEQVRATMEKNLVK